MKPSELTRKIRNDYGLNITPTNIMVWERADLIPNTGYNERGRRDYTDDNAERILAIALLRCVGLSIKAIRAYFDGDTEAIAMARERVSMYVMQILPAVAKLVN